MYNSTCKNVVQLSIKLLSLW